MTIRFPATVAVGVPELTFKTANLAEAVDCPPIVKSTVELLGFKTPAVWFQKASLPEDSQEPNTGVVPPSRHWVEVPAVLWLKTPDELA